MTQKQISITVNGQTIQTPSTTLRDLICEMNIQSDYMAVAINNAVIPSAEYDNTTLKPNDLIEVIQPMSGG